MDCEKRTELYSLLVLVLVMAAIALVLALSSCRGFPSVSGVPPVAMIPGPEGKPILAPPAGMTYDSHWNLVSISQPRPVNLWFLYLIGGLVIPFGAVAGWFARDVRLGASLTLSGVSLLTSVYALERYPWLVLIPAGLGLLSVVYLLWVLFQGHKQKMLASAQAKALEAIVPSVESLSPSVQATLKGIIKKEAMARQTLPVVKRVITDVKSMLP